MIYRCYPLPSLFIHQKKLGFAQISWVVLLKAKGVRTPGPPCPPPPCRGHCRHVHSLEANSVTQNSVKIAPKRFILHNNFEKFWGESIAPFPDPFPTGELTPQLHIPPLGAPYIQILATSFFGLQYRLGLRLISEI